MTTLVSILALYLLVYGRPSGVEGGLLFPYMTHVTGERVVALTFDDGPDPTYTPQILRVLARYDVPATFFVLGRHVDAHPTVLRQIIAAGHSLGNHSYSHRLFRGAWPGDIQAELRQTDTALFSAADVRTRLLRHPGGTQGAFLPFVALAGGWHVVVWSVDPCDYTQPGPEEIARRVLDAVHPGAIILLHDGSPSGKQSRLQTVEALSTILEGLRSRGYRLVTLGPTLAASKQPEIAQPHHERAASRS